MTRFTTNPSRVRQRDQLIPLLQALLIQRTTAEWETLLASADIPHGAVQPMDVALASEQTAARGMVQEVTDADGRTYRVLGNPVHWQPGSSPAVSAPQN